jgi:outer membrane receptor protein involved in Fe transport
MYKYLFAPLPALLMLNPWPLAAAEPEELVISGYRPVTTQELDTSITLLDTATIELATLANFEQIVQLVPNMNLSGEANRARYFQLRGIGEREQYEGAPNPSVGFILDDIDLSGIGGVTSTFDMGQIEILRGPQSARYGSSALAGVVYAQTVQPSDEFSAQAELTVGSNDTRIVGAAIGGSLSENLSGRFSIYKYEDDGFRKNQFLGRDDTNGRDELTYRGKLSWDISDDWNALLTVFVADFDNGYDAFALDNSEHTFSDEPGRDEQKTRAGSLRINGPLGASMQLVSITTAADSDILFSFDSDWVNEEFWAPIVYDYRYINPRTRKNMSQEFRLVSSPEGRLFSDTTDWVLGVFYSQLDEKNEIDSTGEYIDQVTPPPFDCPPGLCISDRQIQSEFDSETLAVFGGLDVALSDATTLSFGLRLERWDARYRDMWEDNGVFAVTPLQSNQFDPDDNLVGGHISLSHEWSDELRGYARVARGFKAGGFNPSLQALGGPGELVSYDPEALWNYELGLKGELMSGNLSYDLAVFYMDRDDAQLSQSNQLVLADPNTFVFITGNGEARSYGLEGSLLWQVSDHLEFHGALGLLDTKITQWEVNPAVEGRSLAHAPGYTLNLGGTWRSAGGVFVRIDLNRVDDFYYDISHNQKSDDYSIVNMRLGKEWSHWSASLWARNLFDENYNTRGFFFGNEPPLFEAKNYTKFGDPRQIGLTLKYRY